MTVETISSNVVNYLVWRYLQEAGYANAALQLSRCWNREPETLPFAKNVSHYTLVHLLQDGLQIDGIRAETTGERRYRFGGDHGRPFSSRNGEMLTLDEGIPAHQLAEEAVSNGPPPEPAPRRGPGKKKKGVKTNGIEARMNTQVNGDAMDIDQNGNTHVTNSVRAESEAVASEAESPSVADIPLSTLTIGQNSELQTADSIRLGSAYTTWCSITDEGRSVEQTVWGTPEAPLLLTAGKSLFKLHLVPKYTGTNSAPRISSLDLGDKLPLSTFSLTAVCFNSHADMTVSAHGEQVNEGGQVLKSDTLFKITDGGQACNIITSTAGFVTTLRWNDASQMLLCISTDGYQKGHIKIWTGQNQSQAPAWTASSDSTIIDAVWISEKAFVVCGEQLLQIYEIDEQRSDKATEQIYAKAAFETQATWMVVKYEASSRIIAAIDPENGLLGVVHPSSPSSLQIQESLDGPLSSFDFRPQPAAANTPAESPVLLATSAAVTGMTRVWDANHPFKPLYQLPTVHETHAVAFSPDGVLLAAAGPYGVTAWDLDKQETPIASWRPEDQIVNEWNTDVADVDNEVKLGWEPDSSRLSIALGNQIAIITIPR